MDKNFVWINGKFIKGEKATVPLLTHSLHYGSAVFEGIRFYNTDNGPAVFRLDEHIQRLFYSAKVMGMKIQYSQKELRSIVLELVLKNKLTSGYIRPIVFFGSKMGLNPMNVDLNVAIACWSWGKYLEKDVIKVKISKFIRIHPESSVMGAKISGHYFNSILATLEAKNNKCDEALLLDYKGNIAEGPGENIFFIKNKKIYTPTSEAILPGITRATVIKLARDLGYVVIEKRIRPKDINNFDEAFFTGTAAEMTAIGWIDGIKIGNGKEGPITKQLSELYHNVVGGKIKKYQNYLSHCNK